MWQLGMGPCGMHCATLLTVDVCLRATLVCTLTIDVCGRKERSWKASMTLHPRLAQQVMPFSKASSRTAFFIELFLRFWWIRGRKTHSVDRGYKQWVFPSNEVTLVAVWIHCNVGLNNGEPRLLNWEGELELPRSQRCADWDILRDVLFFASRRLYLCHGHSLLELFSWCLLFHSIFSSCRSYSWQIGPHAICGKIRNLYFT